MTYITAMRVMGIVGWSGSGKTTLLSKLIPYLIETHKLRISTIKHAHHGFDIDKPGKDSHTHRVAGATEVMLASDKRWALMHEIREEAPEHKETLISLLQHLSPVDLVLVEGFKASVPIALEVHRKTLDKPLIYPTSPAIKAVAHDDQTSVLDNTVLSLDLNDIPNIADFILQQAIHLPTNV